MRAFPLVKYVFELVFAVFFNYLFLVNLSDTSINNEYNLCQLNWCNSVAKTNLHINNYRKLETKRNNVNNASSCLNGRPFIAHH